MTFCTGRTSSLSIKKVLVVLQSEKRAINNTKTSNVQEFMNEKRQIFSFVNKIRMKNGMKCVLCNTKSGYIRNMKDEISKHSLYARQN